MKLFIFFNILFLLGILIPLDGLRADDGASLYLSPAKGTYLVNSTFDISVFVDTGGENINAVQVDLKFPPDELQVVNPTTGSSFISVWVSQPTYSNVKGTIDFQGGAPNPGINTSSGLISTITFRAKASGIAKISFSDSCKILLNGAQGTNYLTSVNYGVYTIVVPPPEGPVVYSLTHPDQNKWYNNNNPDFEWEKETGVTDFSYSINNDPYSVPDNISEGNHTSMAYTDLDSSIWYFHIKAKRNDSWGGISHFPVKIDTIPPADFSIKFESDKTSAEPIISFLTTDALSGIDRYEFKLMFINNNNNKNAEETFFTEVVSPYKISEQKPGAYGIVIRAYDKAGNWKDAITEIVVTDTVDKIKWFETTIETGRSIYVFIIGLVIVLGSGFFYYKTKKKQKRLKKETEDIDKALHYSHDLLKEEIGEKLTKLNKARSQRELNEQEKKIEQELKADLDVAEKYIEKEIKDVEQKLKTNKKNRRD